jgi:hypothetical protein
MVKMFPDTSSLTAARTLWYQQVQTDRTISNNKLEIVILDNEQDLIIEIQHMWHVKTKVIPVTVGATGTISECFRKYMSSVPAKHEIKDLQKTVMFGHSTRTSESTNVEAQRSLMSKTALYAPLTVHAE